MNVSINKESNNLTWVEIHDLELWYSYKTVIAFRYKGELFISENVWSNTTAKHLNEVNPNKDLRIPFVEFERELNRITIGQIQLEI